MGSPLAHIRDELAKYDLLPYVRRLTIEGVPGKITAPLPGPALPSVDVAAKQILLDQTTDYGDQRELSFVRPDTNPNNKTSDDPVNMIAFQSDFEHHPADVQDSAIIIAMAIELAVHEGLERYAATDGWTESSWFPHDQNEFPTVNLHLSFESKSYSPYVCFS